MLIVLLGISRTSRHKRSASGAQRAHYRKKRKFELGRQPASTKLGAKRIHTVRVRGGNLKYRALRLDSGNFAWGSEQVTKKTRIIGVVRTNLLWISVSVHLFHPGVQCFQQRTCTDEHTRQERHYPDRCYAFPSMVRGTLRPAGDQEGQAYCRCRRDC